MKLTILGSGTPEPYVRRASSGYLLDVGQDVILFDCGGGVFDNLLRAGRQPTEITHIVFSHLHSDHMMDYARLIHAAWDMGGSPVKVFGPAPIAQITDGIFGPTGMLAHDLRARTELPQSQQVWTARGGTLPRPWPAPDITEIAPGDQITGKGWHIRTCEVPHAQPELVCMGLSLENGAKTFVYSGDAGLCEGLRDLAKDADLLLHWCYRHDGGPATPEMARVTPTPSEIGKMAAAAGVKKLLLTHIRVSMDKGEMPADMRAALRSSFDGPSEIVEDLQVYDI